jgi:hypothetical protein
MTADTRNSTPDIPGLPGNESFYEHVHLTFGGNYRLALGWARQGENFLPVSIKSHAAPNWTSQENCERRLGPINQKRALVLQSVLKRLQQPPFSNQSNNAQRFEELREQEIVMRQ